MGFRGAPFAFDAPDAAVAAMSAVVPRVPPEEADAAGRAKRQAITRKESFFKTRLLQIMISERGAHLELEALDLIARLLVERLGHTELERPKRRRPSD